MTTATPTRPTPTAMPARRPERPAVQASTPRQAPNSPDRTFTRNPGELTSTIGAALALREDRAVDLELLYRPACNQACDRVQAYAEEVPTGKTKRRWQQATAEKSKAQLELWFGLSSEEDYKPNLLPNVLNVVQKIFVETCVEFGIVGALGQDTSWYHELEPKVKATFKAKAASSTSRDVKKTKPQPKATPSDSVKQNEPAATSQEGLRRACKDATSYLERFGRTPAKGSDETSRRWSENKLAIAVRLLTAYFFNTSAEEAEKIEAELNDNAISVVRSKFAYACVKGKVQGAPGQLAKWYAEVEAATRQFIQSRRPARPSR